MENDKVVKDFRLYWNQPTLAAQLSEEQRKKVIGEFFRRVEKNKNLDASSGRLQKLSGKK